ncbi:MAG: hypothetical protein HUJ68_00405 [Clostridia bacterium]|nr:hypothetical protein [Clostridia bacterium]
MDKLNKKDNFSVALGLTDYINPIMYLVTSATIILNINKIMNLPCNIFYIIGVIVSLVFGFTIPTVKVLVGLGKIKFKLPVNFVFYVNSGIFLSGLMLVKNILNINILLFISIIVLSVLILAFIYFKSKKFNNIAVLTGAIGYLLIYISLIAKAMSCKSIISIICYAIAILLYLMLITIGIKANLKDARVHWVIEISNIICQSSVAIGTLILFIYYI